MPAEAIVQGQLILVAPKGVMTHVQREQLLLGRRLEQLCQRVVLEQLALVQIVARHRRSALPVAARLRRDLDLRLEGHSVPAATT